MVGYLPFAAANHLVGTGRYEFWQATCWGYVIRVASHGVSHGWPVLATVGRLGDRV